MSGRDMDKYKVTRRNVNGYEREVNSDNWRNYGYRSREFNRNNGVDSDRSSRLNWRCRDNGDRVETMGRFRENKPWYRRTYGNESVRKQSGTGGVYYDENRWRGRTWNDRQRSYPNGVVNNKEHNNDYSMETESLEEIRWKPYGGVDAFRWKERKSRDSEIRNGNTLNLTRKVFDGKTLKSGMDLTSGKYKSRRAADMSW
jgi:hypothetical protein